ncbi:hypothetical protein [Rhodoflexus sp.]
MKKGIFFRYFSAGKFLLLLSIVGMMSCYHAPRTAWTPVKPKRIKPDVYPR